MDPAVMCIRWLACIGLLAQAPLALAQADATLKMRADAERRAAVAVPGAQVCRQVGIGVGITDLIKGTVVAVSGDTLGVRVEAPGRFGQLPDGRELRQGMVLSESAHDWLRCLH